MMTGKIISLGPFAPTHNVVRITLDIPLPASSAQLDQAWKEAEMAYYKASFDDAVEQTNFIPSIGGDAA